MLPFPSPPSSVTLTQQVKGFQTFQSTNATTPANNADASDTFYIKLTELLDSSGLSLIVNVRETLLDLYLFYLEVTKRGGYHQVARGKKWGEVVSALKLEGCNTKLSGQVERLYARFLYQYEQLYFYRTPSKHAAAASSNKGSSKGKWKSRGSLSQLKNIQDGQMVTKMCPYQSYQTTGNEFVEQQVVLPVPSTGEEKKKRRGAPRGRNGYQIFLKKECARLKTSGEVSDGTNIRSMATDAWNKMSETEKQPYVEESKKMKENSKEAMISDTKQQNNMEWMGPSVSGDYYVTFQPEADN